MPYDPAVYTAVYADLSAKRQRARAQQERRREEIYAKIPQIAQFDAELSRTALSVARAVLNGNAAELIEGLRLRNQQLQSEKRRLLRENGYAEDYLEIPYACPVCKDEGFVDTKMCGCTEKALRDEAYRRLNEVSALDLYQFEDFSLDYYAAARDPQLGVAPRAQMEQVLLRCRRYAEAFGSDAPNLFLYGKTGLGKTHLSLAIAGCVIGKGYGVVYGSVSDLIGRVEQQHFSRAEQSRDLLDGLLDCDLLILDDLGAEFSNSFSVATLYNLLNTRLQRGRPTIVNTNLSMKELLDRYGERFTSRIIGCYETLRFVGSDIRQLKKQR